MSRKFSDEMIQGIWDKASGHCWYCGKALVFESRLWAVNEDSFTVDHIIPGIAEENNLVPACMNCNSAKGKKTLAEFRYTRATHMARVKEGRPLFSKLQKDWLESVGLQLPPLQHYEFYFEKERLLP